MGELPPACSHLAERKPCMPFLRREVQGGLGQAPWDDGDPVGAIPDLSSQLQIPPNLVSPPALGVQLKSGSCTQLCRRCKAGSLPPSCPRRSNSAPGCLCSFARLLRNLLADLGPFFSPRLVTFHCSELWPAHVGVRENWLCWAGTTSRPQLVPPGSPPLRVSAQLPGPAAGGSRDAPTRPAGQDAAGRAPRRLPSPCHFSRGLRICMVPNHLDIPHPAADWCVRGVSSPWHQTCPHFLVPQ